MSPRLLIVEDDTSLAEMLALHFEDAGFACEHVGLCADASELIQAGNFDLMLLDQQLPDGRGIDLLSRALTADPALIVVMMTGQHDLELAIDAIKAGAADFVHKPIRTAELTDKVQRLLGERDLARQSHPTESGTPAPERDLIGRSDAMLAVSREIAVCARSPATVLISGESGTGKEVVARLIHRHSARPGPFIAVNCAAIVDTLLESELFGHERGAFTGAQSRKQGRFELAQGGTLFLDEVGELAPPLQAKLLRALQERVVERVGGSTPIAVDCRVVAATNRDLTQAVKDGTFREDLLYRLRVIEIRLPSLRERLEDVPMLARGLLTRISEGAGIPCPILSEPALARLLAHDWPGNVRELENRLTQASVRARNGVITPDLLGMDTPASATGRDRRCADTPRPLRTLDEVESEHIQLVLDHTGGHKGRTCEILGISRPALDRKIARYGLRMPGRRSAPTSGP